MSDAATEVEERAAVYEIGGHRFEAGTRALAEAVATAHADRQRPRCLCKLGADRRGIEMYIARLHDSYIVKRMPDTGYQHAPACESYAPPADDSGLGQVLGSAINEDPSTGETTLRLDFAMSKLPGRSSLPPTGGASDGGSVTSDGTRLSLRGLLHYLWDQAGLTRWQPGFAGKRTWGVVRQHLLRAAAQTTIGSGGELAPRLYIPEPFSVEQREAIDRRRLTHWLQALPQPGKPQALMLLIGEVKEIMPARYGYKAVIRHLPDQAFAIDETLYRRLGRRFEAELALWASDENLRMVMVATFAVRSTGIPCIVELSLMPVTWQWLPVEDAFEKQLLERLVAEGRRFTKGLRFNLAESESATAATLTDCNGAARALFIGSATDCCASYGTESERADAWVWQPALGAMPNLPA